MFTFAICCHPTVCRLSLGNARAPYSQAVEIFGNISTALGTLAAWPPVNIHQKFYGDRSSQGNPSVGELNRTGIAKYSDFGPTEDYISKTVQDRR